MGKIIRELWLLSSDRSISDDEIESRAEQWLKLFGDSLFNERYRYKIETVCDLHQTHGRPIMAPELFQVSERVEAGLLHQGNDNWIPVSEVQTTIWNADPKLREIKDFEQVRDEINRRIYGGR